MLTQSQWLLLSCTNNVMMIPDDLMWWPPDVSSPMWPSDVRTQAPPSLVYPPTLSHCLLMPRPDVWCGVDWLLNDITWALSLMSAISRSASAQNLSMFEQNSAVYFFMLLRDESRKKTKWLKKWFIEKIPLLSSVIDRINYAAKMPYFGAGYVRTLCS